MGPCAVQRTRQELEVTSIQTSEEAGTMDVVPGGEMKEEIRKPVACVDKGEGGGWQVLSAYSAKK